MVEIMGKRPAELLDELEELKVDNHHQSEMIALLKCQVNQKDREIQRLQQELDGVRPQSAVSRECVQCKQKDVKIKSLEECLDATMIKQHEAMSRALHLAEQNQQLERELKDLDNMALAMEEECQHKIKQNLRNMEVLQEKLREKIDEIKNLEDTVKDMTHKIERDKRELENLKSEKKVLERNLNFATNEKKNLNDKINHFLLIEKNLTSEISRLQDINKNLQRQIGDMEERVLDVLGTDCKRRPKGKQKKGIHSLGVSSLGTDPASNIKTSKPLGEENERCCGDHLNECSHPKSSISALDKIEEERDFYHRECHRLKDLFGNFQARSDNKVDLMRELKDREREIMDLKQETFSLRRENCALVKRFECGDHLSSFSSGDSIKIILDRLEKERDMALSDISRLQGERDALKEKLKLATESQIGEQSRLERIVMENEERIRRLESERKELISNHSSQRIAVISMEEKCDEYKEQVREAQAQLAQMTANYNQLKTLQEETDRTLSDLQGRFSQTAIELRFATSKTKELEKEKENLENEISALKKEKSSLKSSLAYLEKEKDGLLIALDEKTEKVAKLENQIKKQETSILELGEEISNLEKKFQFTLNEKTNREHGLRTLERAVEHLKEELAQCEQQKESLARENRRIQDDLASAVKDCLLARRDLDAEKQEVENLKRQLQQYVSEVKRAEELLTKKESERNQMLDHFRSLSLEATALETNNHTLESTVENTKTQLMSANNRIMDLEHEVSSKDSLLYNYEKQMAELTTRIAELETKLKQQTDLRSRAEEDLSALRDLCSSIDSQKEALRRQASSHDVEKTQLMNEVRRLSEEYEGLNEKLTYERSLSQTLEKSLSNSRQETLEHKITNKDLQTHVQHLRQKVDDLTQKLESESQDVRRYQAQCADLSQQVSELRREVTNARFEQAKAMEDSRRSDSAFTPESEEEEEDHYSFPESLPASSKTFIRSTGEKKLPSFTPSNSPAASRRTPYNSLSFVLSEQSFFRPRLLASSGTLPFMDQPHQAKNLPYAQNSRTDDQTLPQTFGRGEEVKEIRFEAHSHGNSARNIPPLTFSEGTDRTTSLESDREEEEYVFRKFDWKLSPLLEKSARGSEADMHKADTTSELSSLPEDSEPRNGFTKRTLSNSDGAYPTYSLRESPTYSQTQTYDLCKKPKGVPDGTGLSPSCTLHDGPGPFPSGGTTGRNHPFSVEETSVCEVGPCWCQEEEKPDETQQLVSESEFSSLPSRAHSELSGVGAGCQYQ